MLVGVTAVSIIVLMVLGLTGDFIAPADSDALAPNVTVVASAGMVSGSVSTPLLGSIRSIDPAALPGFLSTHHADVDRMLASPPAAAEISQFWRLLGPASQSVMMQSAPQLVGNLEGVPYTVRGKANTLTMKRTIDEVNAKLRTERGKAERLALQHQLTTLQNVQTALEKKGGAKRTLVSLDPSPDAKAVIVVGDLESADYVSVLVPGMYMSVGEQIVSWAAVAQDLYDQQRGFLMRFLGPRSNITPPGVAVVAWIGYQTPVLTNIGGLQLAEQGAASLARTLTGIRELRQGDQPYLSVFAHSYGTTAALIALERRTVTVDALALMGSPGSSAQSVAELSVAEGNVFVGEAPMDPIVDSAFFGSDPGSPSYGAKPMSVAGAVDPITHKRLAASSGHNEYFTAGSECVRNVALIGIDQPGLVL